MYPYVHVCVCVCNVIMHVSRLGRVRPAEKSDRALLLSLLISNGGSLSVTMFSSRRGLNREIKNSTWEYHLTKSLNR